MKTGTKIYSNLPVEFEHWEFYLEHVSGWSATSETKNLGDDMSATSCKTGTSWVFPLTPLDRITVVVLTVGREVSVTLSHGSLWKCDHIQKDASSAGNSPGINFKANGQLFFLLFDNWCYKIILVPGPRRKLFDVRNLVLPYMKLQVLVELFSCPTICKIPETCPPSGWVDLCRGAEMQKDGFTARDSWEVAAVDRPSLWCTLGSLRLG